MNPHHLYRHTRIGLDGVVFYVAANTIYGRQFFTGQKTQPTVSKYWRKKLQRKTEKIKQQNTHINTKSYKLKIYNTYNTQVPWSTLIRGD